MKNLLFLGVVALLLFSLSAALSLWLNQARQDVTTQAEKDKESKELSKEPPKDSKLAQPKPGAAGDLQKEPEKLSIPKLPAPQPGTVDAGVLDQQAKLERKAVQISLVLADVQAQREATDALLKQVTAELKNAAKAPEPEPNAARLQKEREEALKNERTNLIKLAAVYDAMTPEGAAPILKQMAESGTGKLEQAAQILVLMKERNSARLLEALGDVTLAAQLMDKVRQLKAQNAAAPAPPPAAPAALPNGLAPARGP